MPAKKAARKSSKAKVRIAVTIDRDLEDWVKANVGDGRRFGSVSHAVGTALLRLRKDEP